MADKSTGKSDISQLLKGMVEMFESGGEDGQSPEFWNEYPHLAKFLRDAAEEMPPVIYDETGNYRGTVSWQHILEQMLNELESAREASPDEPELSWNQDEMSVIIKESNIKSCCTTNGNKMHVFALSEAGENFGQNNRSVFSAVLMKGANDGYVLSSNEGVVNSISVGSVGDLYAHMNAETGIFNHISFNRIGDSAFLGNSGIARAIAPVAEDYFGDANSGLISAYIGRAGKRFGARNRELFVAFFEKGAENYFAQSIGISFIGKHNDHVIEKKIKSRSAEIGASGVVIYPVYRNGSAEYMMFVRKPQTDRNDMYTDEGVSFKINGDPDEIKQYFKKLLPVVRHNFTARYAETVMNNLAEYKGGEVPFGDIDKILNIRRVYTVRVG